MATIRYEEIDVNRATLKTAGPGEQIAESDGFGFPVVSKDHTVIVSVDEVYLLAGTRKSLRQFGRRIALAYADAAPDGPAVTFDVLAYRKWVADSKRDDSLVDEVFVANSGEGGYAVEELVQRNIDDRIGFLTFGPGVTEVGVVVPADQNDAVHVSAEVDGVPLYVGILTRQRLAGPAGTEVSTTAAALETALTVLVEAVNEAVEKFRCFHSPRAGIAYHLTNDELETALRALAEIENRTDPDDLSKVQVKVTQKVYRLWKQANEREGVTA
jgi:hypothetical protein